MGAAALTHGHNPPEALNTHDAPRERIGVLPLPLIAVWRGLKVDGSVQPGKGTEQRGCMSD